MNEQFTIRQHYVWRRYLKPWKQTPTDKGLWTCLLKQKKVAMIGEMDVAQASSFYKIEELNQSQIDFMKSFIETQPQKVRELGDEMLKAYELYSFYMNGLREGNTSITSIPDIEKKLKVIEINTFEQLNCIVENEGKSLIDCRSIEEIKALTKDELSFSFMYLFVQYLRTRGMKEGFVNSMAERPAMMEIGEKTWPFVVFLMANNLWHSTMAKDDYRLVIVKNTSSTPFITGDQPVINDKDDMTDEEGMTKELELYYPLSPECALLVKFDDGPRYEETIVDQNWVDDMNKKIWHHASYHVFGSNKNVLDDLLCEEGCS